MPGVGYATGVRPHVHRTLRFYESRASRIIKSSPSAPRKTLVPHPKTSTSVHILVKRRPQSTSFPNHMAHRAALISVFLAPARHQFTLRDHEYGQD